MGIGMTGLFCGILSDIFQRSELLTAVSSDFIVFWDWCQRVFEEQAISISILRWEAVCSSETFVPIYQSTLHLTSDLNLLLNFSLICYLNPK